MSNRGLLKGDVVSARRACWAPLQVEPGRRWAKTDDDKKTAALFLRTTLSSGDDTTKKKLTLIFVDIFVTILFTL